MFKKANNKMNYLMQTSLSFYMSGFDLAWYYRDTLDRNLGENFGTNDGKLHNECFSGSSQTTCALNWRDHQFTSEKDQYNAMPLEVGRFTTPGPTRKRRTRPARQA